MTGQTVFHYRILDRTAAVKFIKGGFGERFEREARAISSLNHPNIGALLPRSAIHGALNWTAGLAR